MNETCYPSLKARADLSERSQKNLDEAPGQYPVNSNATPHRLTRATIWATRPMRVLLTGPLPAEPTNDSRMTRFANMSGVASNTAGPQNSLPDASKNYTLICLSAMKLFTSGFMLMLENSSLAFCGPTAIANAGVIPDAIRRRISPTGYRSRNAPKKSSYVSNQGIGKQTPLSRAKAWPHCKSALNARPESPSLHNCPEKELAV